MDDKLLESISECKDSICLRTKIENELRQQYDDAKINIDIAPKILEDTKKNYYIFKEGENYYNEILEKDLNNKANEFINSIMEKFNKQISNIEILNKYMISSMENSQNIKDLYESYKKDRKYLEEKIRNEYGDILINNRKTYYSTEALDKLKQWHIFFWYIYYILVLILIIGFIFINTQTSNNKKIIIIILLLIYPYIIHPILLLFYRLIKFIYSQTAKNVYNNI
jgi:hypothetical protein